MCCCSGASTRVSRVACGPTESRGRNAGAQKPDRVKTRCRKPITSIKVCPLTPVEGQPTWSWSRPPPRWAITLRPEASSTSSTSDPSAEAVALEHWAQQHAPASLAARPSTRHSSSRRESLDDRFWKPASRKRRPGARLARRSRFRRCGRRSPRSSAAGLIRVPSSVPLAGDHPAARADASGRKGKTR